MTDLTTLANDIFEANKEKGFWDNPRPLTETTMLIVTELAEAVEEERAGRPAVWYRDHLSSGGPVNAANISFAENGLAHHKYDFDLAGPLDRGTPPPLKPEGVDVELIDALIRLLDLLGSRGVDVDELLRQKLAFNQTRGVRHGKSY